MDDQRFDKLARVLGSGLSRRGALLSALGGIAAAVTGLSAASEAEARKRKAKAQGEGKQAKNHDGGFPDGNLSGFCRVGTSCSTDRECLNNVRDFGGSQSECRCVRGPSSPGLPGIPGSGTCRTCSCFGKRCGDPDGCGGFCGQCPRGQLCVREHDGRRICKESPVCAPNGQHGICCSGHTCNSQCCDSGQAGATAIIVDVDVFNAITVTTSPNQVITTITVPPPTTPVTPPVGGGGKRRRRRRRRRGGRRRGRR